MVNLSGQEENNFASNFYRSVAGADYLHIKKGNRLAVAFFRLMENYFAL
jgi:hypothetical protein